jgi:hypothetical protein
MKRNLLMIGGVVAVIGGLAGFPRAMTAGVVVLTLALFLLPWVESDVAGS